VTVARVVVYTAPGCHLCGPALDVVESVCGHAFEVVDITSNDELERRYRARIPVVEVDGIERCRYVVDEEELRSLVGTYPG
jgi:glutaredoxin